MNRCAVLAVCVVCLMLFRGVPAFSATESDPLFLESDPAAKVNLSPATIKKYPRLRFVLDKMLEVANTPSAWNLSGCAFSEKVPSTGYFINMTVGDFLPIFRQYLTDGSLNISFRPDFKTSGPRAAGQAVDAHTIYVYPLAGSYYKAGETQGYSDYKLAVTLFHEMVHVWQYRTYALADWRPSKERPTLFMEQCIPSGFFSRTGVSDPDGEAPVPPIFPLIVGKISGIVALLDEADRIAQSAREMQGSAFAQMSSVEASLNANRGKAEQEIEAAKGLFTAAVDVASIDNLKTSIESHSAKTVQFADSAQKAFDLAAEAVKRCVSKEAMEKTKGVYLKAQKLAQAAGGHYKTMQADAGKINQRASASELIRKDAVRYRSSLTARDAELAGAIPLLNQTAVASDKARQLLTNAVAKQHQAGSSSNRALLTRIRLLTSVADKEVIDLIARTQTRIDTPLALPDPGLADRAASLRAGVAGLRERIRNFLYHMNKVISDKSIVLPDVAIKNADNAMTGLAFSYQKAPFETYAAGCLARLNAPAIKPQPVPSIDCSSIPGSAPVRDASTQRHVCRCASGHRMLTNAYGYSNVCVPADVEAQIARTDCSKYPHSAAYWDVSAGKPRCKCLPGYKSNAEKTACVRSAETSPSPTASDCSRYPGAISQWDEKTKAYRCVCKKGFAWNGTACGPDKEAQLRMADCSRYKNAKPFWSEQEQKAKCKWCPDGQAWLYPGNMRNYECKSTRRSDDIVVTTPPKPAPAPPPAPASALSDSSYFVILASFYKKTEPEWRLPECKFQVVPDTESYFGKKAEIKQSAAALEQIGHTDVVIKYFKSRQEVNDYIYNWNKGISPQSRKCKDAADRLRNKPSSSPRK